jgi:hypothetical protein
MFEVGLLFLFMSFIAVCAFSPLGGGLLLSPKHSQQSCAATADCSSTEFDTSEEPAIKYSFLASMQHEIESALCPRPTDSILQRHYDALVNAELESRLAAMPDS